MVISSFQRLPSHLSQLKRAPGRTSQFFSTVFALQSWFMGNSASQTMANPFVIPPSGKHTATVIFLHGLGDTGQGWASAFESIREPYIKYVCPNAPIAPVSLNGGFKMPSWFDIKGLSPDSDEDEGGIKEASDALQAMIADEEKKGIPRNRIMVGGFSQGGAVSLYSAFSTPKDPVAGIIALSTWMPLHKEFPKAAIANRETPIIQCHGTGDQVVPYPFGMLTSQLLGHISTKHEFKSYPMMGHMSIPQEMDDVQRFIKDHLPPV